MKQYNLQVKGFENLLLSFSIYFQLITSSFKIMVVLIMVWKTPKNVRADSWSSSGIALTTWLRCPNKQLLLKTVLICFVLRMCKFCPWAITAYIGWLIHQSLFPPMSLNSTTFSSRHLLFSWSIFFNRALSKKNAMEFYFLFVSQRLV